MIITSIAYTNKAYAKIDVPENQNALIYQLHGKSKIYGVETGDNKMITFRNDGDEIYIEGLSEGTILCVAGIPIEEEIAQHGPFVMNNQTEIREAMRDYQMGKMEVLI